MHKKWIIGIAILFIVSSSIGLHAQTDQLEIKAGKHFADKGVVEVSGDLSLGGTTGDSSFFYFSAGPGVNFFVINNFFLGAGVFASVQRVKVTSAYPFLFTSSDRYVTYWDAGFGVRLGYAFNIGKNAFFNITPEMNFDWYDTGYFRAYPNLLLSLKFIVNNTSINLGFRQNFFYFTNEGDKAISDFLYSYNLSLGFSFYL
jgi:hypothetical protein